MACNKQANHGKQFASEKGQKICVVAMNARRLCLTSNGGGGEVAHGGSRLFSADFLSVYISNHSKVVKRSTHGFDEPERTDSHNLVLPFLHRPRDNGL